MREPVLRHQYSWILAPTRPYIESRRAHAPSFKILTIGRRQDRDRHLASSEMDIGAHPTESHGANNCSAAAQVPVERQQSYYYDSTPLEIQDPINEPTCPLHSVELSNQSCWYGQKQDSYVNHVDYNLLVNSAPPGNQTTAQTQLITHPTIYYSEEQKNHQTDNYFLYQRNGWQNNDNCHHYNYGYYENQPAYTEEAIKYYQHGNQYNESRLVYYSDNLHTDNSDVTSGANADGGYYTDESGVPETKPQLMVYAHSSSITCEPESSNTRTSGQHETKQAHFIGQWKTLKQQHNQLQLAATQSQNNERQVRSKPVNARSTCKSVSITNQRANLCRVCGRNYARPSTLKTHLRTHTNERPFKCDVCFKTFSQAANLTAHQRVHTGERPFSCPICSRQFSQSSSVITHLRTHSGERPYRCSMCNRTFSDSSTLTKHCRIHSGEKPYQCQYCPLNFSQSGNLSRHLKLHLMLGTTSGCSSSSNQSSFYDGSNKI